jgi:hypothetical protein
MAKRDGGEALDPRGLIAEAYRIEGIGPAECRAILFDWALGGGAAEGDPAALAALHRRHAAAAPDHPMTAVLAEGMGLAPRPRRRGGARGRGAGGVHRA